MKRAVRLSVALCLFLLSLPVAPIAAQRPAPDLILVKGVVFTADPARPTAEAVAIRGGRIVTVGTTAQIEALAGRRTRRVLLNGRLVVPGFNDAHTHYMPNPSGQALRFEPPQPGQPPDPSWEEARRAVEAAAREAAPGTWIFGEVGPAVFLNPEANRFNLDRVAPNHPVLLRTFYGHGYVINSKAMPLLRITEEARDPAGGWYERAGGTQQINGRLWEYAAWRPLRTLSDEVPDGEAVKQLRMMSDEAVRFGITSLQVMSSMPSDRFVRLLARADLPIRVRVIPFSLTSSGGRDLSEVRRLTPPRRRSTRLSASGIKWVLDGTPFEHGAAMRRPYQDRPGWSGRLNFPEQEVRAMVRESLRFNQQLLIHCAGDRSAEVVFDAMEKAGPRADWPGRRVRIEHGDGVRGDLIERARRLGVVVVQNPTHFAPPELFRSRWGGGMQRLRSLLAAGVHVALGSDGPMNPFLNIMLAADHPYDPEEAITREQAVEAYTRGSAYAEFKEGEKGTIATGKAADLAVLSRNIFAADRGELLQTYSLLTLVGGRAVHDTGELQASY
jgi:predicted amidohydrolase YtcJ